MNQEMQDRYVVTVHDTHAGAEAAVNALQQAGFDMKGVSIAGKDYHTGEHAVGFSSSGARVRFWGEHGGFWGALWGMLFDGGFFFIPTIGPLVVMGPFVDSILGALGDEAWGGAAGVLATALTTLGIPSDSVSRYELAVKAGNILVVARASAAGSQPAHPSGDPRPQAPPS